METVFRRVSYEKYILGILLALFFLIGGIFFGNYLAEKKTDDISVSQKAISALLNIIELKENLSQQGEMDSCSLSHEYIWNEKVAIGTILTALELRLGKDNLQVKEQKTIYNEVQLKTLNLVKNVNENCNKSWEIILFFYTNDKHDSNGDYKLSELQGYALDGLYARNKETVKIFSFDVSLKNPSIISLMQEYNLTKTPALVINGKAYPRFMSRGEIQGILR